ncbi:MAG: DUF4113 domain-containing protein [Azospirillum sp.]|nr:DUF4113 domain-containing protein [Azospirillum sp.]
MTAFGLLDVNNMFVSCHRVFDPSLAGRPVIVLSSNDGCAVARSDEAKALGIRMADPYFKIAKLCQANRVTVLSSNFGLYCDLSTRTMAVIAEHAPAAEQYSIDECFLDLTGMVEDLAVWCQGLRATVQRWVGLPTTIGTGPTRTLAKLANRLAKKSKRAEGVLDLAGHPEWVETALARTPVLEVWGIGKASAAKLAARDITDALRLRHADDRWLRQQLGISGLRTVQELRGIPCHDLEIIPDQRQSCTVSRSFGQPTGRLEDVRDAVVAFAGKAAAKLRSEKLVAGALTVYAATNRFRSDLPQRTLTACVTLYPAASDTRRIVQTAVAALERAWESGPWAFTKAGLLLADLVAEDAVPRDLFSPPPADPSAGLMQAVDSLNHRFGRGTARFGLASRTASWQARQDRKTPHFTSRWSEIPVATA